MTLDDHKHPKHRQYQHHVFNTEETVTKMTVKYFNQKPICQINKKIFF